MYINKCNISIHIYIFSTELWYAVLKMRHYTGIDGLIESVPASLEERRKKETGHRVTALRGFFHGSSELDLKSTDIME